MSDDPKWVRVRDLLIKAFWPFRQRRRTAWARRSDGRLSPPSIAQPQMADFARRLTEAIAWCSMREAGGDAADFLRTSALQPPDIVDPPVYQENPERWKLPEETRLLIYGRAQIERRRITLALSERRADLLWQNDQYPNGPKTDLAAGRLLFYAPDEQFADGLAEGETGGFFDVNNVPPWDTWVDYVQENDTSCSGVLRAYIICWIPPALLDTADRGISVNPEGSIGWVSNIKTNFTYDLGRVGLLGR